MTQIVYGPSILFTKLAILLLYRRVFLVHKGNNFDWITRGFMVILVAYYTALTLVKIFECTPREKIWYTKIEGTCVNKSALLNSSGLFNTITDFMLLFIPIRSVWQLKMSTSRKWAIVSVFTLGLT